MTDKNKKSKRRKIAEGIGEVIGEIIISLVLFGIGALAVTLFGGSIDSENMDFDLIMLIGIAIVFIFGALIFVLWRLFKSKRKSNAQKDYTGTAIRKTNTQKHTRTYCFTVDDNIRFLREISEANYESIFEHPYLAEYKRLNEIFGVKVQLNLFYEDEKFNLSEMTDRYREEWRSASDWLKLSFHSRCENVRPYENSGYNEVFRDAEMTRREIIRFATEDALAETTTIHYCRLTEDGCKAISDLGVRGLLGLFGTEDEPRSSYQCTSEEAKKIRCGDVILRDEISYSAIDVILNLYPLCEIRDKIAPFLERDSIKIMIHEQYFYSDYKNYQKDFSAKLYDAFYLLKANGYESVFFEEII